MDREEEEEDQKEEDNVDRLKKEEARCAWWFSYARSSYGDRRVRLSLVILEKC